LNRFFGEERRLDDCALERPDESHQCWLQMCDGDRSVLEKYYYFNQLVTEASSNSW